VSRAVGHGGSAAGDGGRDSSEDGRRAKEAGDVDTGRRGRDSAVRVDWHRRGRGGAGGGGQCSRRR
jgi:hypothetical protein